MQSETRIDTHVKINTSIAGNVTKYNNCRWINVNVVFWAHRIYTILKEPFSRTLKINIGSEEFAFSTNVSLNLGNGRRKCNGALIEYIRSISVSSDDLEDLGGRHAKLASFSGGYPSYTVWPRAIKVGMLPNQGRPCLYGILHAVRPKGAAPVRPNIWVTSYLCQYLLTKFIGTPSAGPSEPIWGLLLMLTRFDLERPN